VIYYIRNSIDGLIGFYYNQDKYYYIKNNLNDIIGILDNDYNVVANYTYDAWGNILSITDSNGIDIRNNQNHIENINSYIQGIVGTTGIIFDAFVTIVVSVYMLLERDQIKGFFAKLSEVIFSKKVNDSLVKYFRKTNSIFFSYISGQIIDAVVVGIIIGIALTLMKVKYGILLGFLVGLFNIIPYFGAIFAVVLTIIITIFTGGITKAIAVAVVIIVLQQIDANIINPKILGTSLNLSPILVIFSVTVGGSYFGVLGMFLGVPAIAFIKLLITNFIEYRTKIKFEQTFK